MRFVIELAYKGTAYHGWQKQENAHAIQSEIEQKLSLILGENTEILGCGRTDTGVHAAQFFAHFDTSKNIDCSLLQYKLNQILPADISVYKILLVANDFNARFDAISRTYEYHITRIRNPFKTDTAWFQYGELDIAKMNEAAKLLLDHKNFECFSKVHTQVNNFICDISLAEWQELDSSLVFTIKANRFLRNMVRAIVGTLIEVGRSKLSLEQFHAILNSNNRSEAGQSVPAQGLFLVKIEYPINSLNQVTSN